MTWYIVATCEECKSKAFLFSDLTEGKNALDANYIVMCPRCAHKGGYAARHYCHSFEQQEVRAPAALAATA